MADFVHDLLRPGQLPTLKWGAWVESGAKADRRERFTTMLRLLLDWTFDWSRTRASLPPFWTTTDPARVKDALQRLRTPATP